VVDEQMKDLDEQMTSLDDFVTRARSQNATHHDQHSESVEKLSATVQESYGNIKTHFGETFSRVEELGSEMESATGTAQEALEPLPEHICQPLANLREEISATLLQEYQPTGSTPQKVVYEYPTDLPHTKTHSALINELHGGGIASSPSKASSIGGIFADADHTLSENRSPSRPHSSDSACDRNNLLSMSLREVHPNVSTGSLGFDSRAAMSASVGPGILLGGTTNSTVGLDEEDNNIPLLKRSRTATSNVSSVVSGKTISGIAKKTTASAEGRENMPPSGIPGSEIFAQSASRRKSPRLH
jgi:kinesin family member 11